MMDEQQPDEDYILRVLTSLTDVYRLSLPELERMFGVSAADLEAFIMGKGTLSEEQIKQIYRAF